MKNKLLLFEAIFIMLSVMAFSKSQSIYFTQSPLDKDKENDIALFQIDKRAKIHTLSIEFLEEEVASIIDHITIYKIQKNKTKKLLSVVDIKEVSKNIIELHLKTSDVVQANQLLITATPLTNPLYEQPLQFKLCYNQLEGLSPIYRVGYALRSSGDDNAKCYRIPALAVTKNKTLIAVYDVRYDGEVDLPNNIDIGMSRSTDGGQHWEPMKIILDMGNDPIYHGDGVGDPSILVDENSGRIWVAAVWSHGDRAWYGSGQGVTPQETGQFLLIYSDDDGKSWSGPINITEMVKEPSHHFFFQAPGCGITMQDGTLVFPAQYRDETPQRVPYSTIIYSKDGGKSWKRGNGVRAHTTENQVVELSAGTLMINCRDDLNKMDKKRKESGGRAVYISKDLGETWEKHPSSDWTLPEPNCQASILKLDNTNLVFFNPNAHRSIGADKKGGGRRNFTLQLSRDLGENWSKKIQFDDGYGRGYSSMALLDDILCIIYEGSKSDIFFQKISLKEILKE